MDAIAFSPQSHYVSFHVRKRPRECNHFYLEAASCILQKALHLFLEKYFYNIIFHKMGMAISL